ncbi:MAG: hypothetical protein BIFFINMI_01825 [Phycisphaerae bacterium]|nr:hypothetical protein [Phycisphaerae bacterium]
MSLTRPQIEFYRQNGYLAVPNLVPVARVRALREKIEWLCENWESDEARAVGLQQEADSGNAEAVAVARTAQTVRKFTAPAAHIDIFRQHAHSAEVLDAVVDLIGRPVGLYTDQALLKPPRFGSEKPPHQDNEYFRVTPADGLVTAWLAVDDATVENGCMYYIPGSHKLGRVEHEAIANTPHLVPKGCRREDAVAVPIGAGGVIFHHGWTLHFSTPNRSDKWRRAYPCHYARTDATFGNLQGAGMTDPPPTLRK